MDNRYLFCRGITRNRTTLKNDVTTPIYLISKKEKKDILFKEYLNSQITNSTEYLDKFNDLKFKYYLSSKPSKMVDVPSLNFDSTFNIISVSDKNNIISVIIIIDNCVYLVNDLYSKYEDVYSVYTSKSTMTCLNFDSNNSIICCDLPCKINIFDYETGKKFYKSDNKSNYKINSIEPDSSNSNIYYYGDSYGNLCYIDRRNLFSDDSVTMFNNNLTTKSSILNVKNAFDYYLITTMQNGDIRVYDKRIDNKYVYKDQPEEFPLRSIAVNEAKRGEIATGISSIQKINIFSGNKFEYDIGDNFVSNINFNPLKNTIIVSYLNNGLIDIYDNELTGIKNQNVCHNRLIGFSKIIENGNKLITASNDEKMKIWTINNSKTINAPHFGDGIFSVKTEVEREFMRI